MGIGQLVRRAGLKVKKTGTWLSTKVKRDKSGSGGLHEARIVRLSGKAVLGLIGLIVLYYIGGALLLQKVDNDINFQPEARLQQGQSASVAMAVALIDREINSNGWTANDPFFRPTYLLDNMPNYQLGMISAIGRFSFELRDQLGRNRGSSQEDTDLYAAANGLAISGKRWMIDPSESLMPTWSAEREYKVAAEHLTQYNQRLLSGDAIFVRRADNLLATLDRIALDLGSASDQIDSRISGLVMSDAEEGARDATHASPKVRRNIWPIHTKTDDVFYNVKGRAYAYYMILTALGEDFEDVIAEKNLETLYDEMLRSLEIVATQEPGIILNGTQDSQMVPCHLCGQGFYLLRARTQLREITNILLK